ncbi:hypothetical protein CK911_01160 [Aeromonas sp. CU5]|nr:hypothetical protein CK911_01160 [Aeromonas sp. CU5]
MNNKSINVAIVGAGLNGLALALSLRVFGIDATVYEKSDKPRIDGTGIIMWPEGMQVLAALTDAAKVKNLGNTIDILTTATFSSEILSRISMRQIGGKVNADVGLFHRRELYQLLLDTYGAEKIVTGQHCTVENDVILLNGEPLIADVIVGVDGVFSQVRKFVAPHVALRYPNVYCCRGMVDYYNPALSDNECYVFAGIRSRIVTYTYNRETHGKYWFAACRVNSGEALNKQKILDQFSSYSTYLLEMIEKTPEDKILPSQLVDIAPFEQWSRGNAVLLGDSCCAVLPTMGIGFSLGIENAFILAQSLASNFFDIPQAFARYTYRAQQRSHDLQNITHRLSELTYTEVFDPSEVTLLYQRFTKVNSNSPF